MKILFLSSSILSVICCFSQKRSSFEVTPLIRYDNYAAFKERIGNASYTSDVTLKGISWGVNAQYRLPFSNKWQGKIGVGYYKYGFNQITHYDSRFGGLNGNARYFRYPSGNLVLFYTDKYWYNTSNLVIGIDRLFTFNNNYELMTGVNLINYFTYSQKFYVTNNPPDYPPVNRNDFYYFGYSSYLNIGLIKKFIKYYIGAQAMISIINNFKQDEIFYENKTDTRHKWANGYGASIVFGYYFKR